MKIDPWHAHQRQHDRLRSDKTVHQHSLRFLRARVRHRIQVVDVQFIRGLRTIRIGFVRHQPISLLHLFDQTGDISFRQNAPRRVEPDAIVRGEKIEEGHLVGG